MIVPPFMLLTHLIWVNSVHLLETHPYGLPGLVLQPSFVGLSCVPLSGYYCLNLSNQLLLVPHLDRDGLCNYKGHIVFLYWNGW